ncbi:hypothetical protein ABZ471_41890 [Streptomyces sp. NPDC005728]|uniref:arsenate reductase/protein-tyrosine-phosphatase family protein n=1 Tax=Streptomyces sp. NPDC005728 TaxID=3157054 RepID=UPI0034015F22
MRKVLTVCLGNYCRSPIAALALARRGTAELEVRSAGLIGKWEGEPANPVDDHRCSAPRPRPHRPPWPAVHPRHAQLDRQPPRDGHCRPRNAPRDLRRGQRAQARALPRRRDVPDPLGNDQEAFNACAVLIEAGTALHVGHQ